MSKCINVNFRELLIIGGVAARDQLSVLEQGVSCIFVHDLIVWIMNNSVLLEIAMDLLLSPANLIITNCSFWQVPVALV